MDIDIVKILKNLNTEVHGKVENGVISLTINLYGIPITFSFTVEQIKDLLKPKHEEATK